MTARRKLFIGIITALVGANIWHWWPTSVHMAGAGGETQRLHLTPEDFRLRVALASDAMARPRRNLFEAVVPKPPVPAAPAVSEKLVAAAVVQPEAAKQDEFAQFKLLGVAFRAGQERAYLTRGSETYMVGAGEVVDGDITVESIALDAVMLKNLKTNTTGKVLLVGNDNNNAL